MLNNLIAKQMHRLYDFGLSTYGLLNSYVSTLFPLHPLVLRIRITKNCNFRCSFCFQSESLNPGEKGHLSLEEWKKIIDKLPRHTVLDVTGGEPFIAKNFFPLMEYFLKKGHKTSVMTNGSIYNEELFNMFVDNKLYYLMFSVEDIGSSHDDIRSAPKSYDKILKNLEAIQKIKKEKNSKYPLIGIKTTILDSNWQNLMKLHEECARLGMIDHHSLNLLKQNGVRGGNEIYPDDSSEVFRTGNTAKYATDPKNLAAQVHALLDRSKETNIPVSFKPNIPRELLEDYFRNPADFGVKGCQKIHGILTMYYDGSIAPCDIGIDVGNVREYDFDLRGAWRAQKFKTYQNKLKTRFPNPPECAGCCLATHEKIS
jgi:MoaA/NifB/PqqE/SkfB family radical SAM enzyme